MNSKAPINCKSVMTQDFEKVDGVTTVQEALKIMRDKNLNQLIVNKRDEQDEYGLVQLSDIAKHVIAKDRAPERVNLYEIMAKPVLDVRGEMDIKYCARLFHQFGLQVAPVTEGEEVVGIVSYRDIVLSWLDYLGE